MGGKSGEWRKHGTTSTQPVSPKPKRKQVRVRAPKTENIIFIGSEMEYDLFWLKRMFVG